MKDGKLQYKDLNLRKLREECGIDFAHYTYINDMCSCCYGPSDFPAKYWHEGKVKDRHEDMSYILFKNANNGSGQVMKNHVLSNKKTIYISWRLSDEQLDAVCAELEAQVGTEFDVIKPKSDMFCIELRRKDLNEN